ncbi:MAG: energy transducer TonB [Pseudoflavonifractor sp.]|nr:energy transducer TonB [Pseudoflavonifractor sp.]
MINTPCKILLLMVLSAVSLAVSAQGRRTVAYHDTRLNRVTHVEVYDYDYVDEQPHFPGGDKAMFKFINQHRRYPAEAYDNRIEGRVLCSFIVNPDGAISHIRILRGVEPTLNAEAVRVITEMPRWVAGKVDDSPVPVFCILPIPFRL